MKHQSRKGGCPDCGAISSRPRVRCWNCNSLMVRETPPEPEYAYCEWCGDTRPKDHRCYSIPVNLNFYYVPGTGEDGE